MTRSREECLRRLSEAVTALGDLSEEFMICGGAALPLLVTKLEAFGDRGDEDFVASHDLEDAITVVDGRNELIDEINNSTQELRLFLAEKTKSLLTNSDFQDALPGHMLPDQASQARIETLLQKLQRIAAQ